MSVYQCRLPYCTGETWQAKGVCDDCFLVRGDQLRELPDLYVKAYALLMPGAKRVAAEQVRLPSLMGVIPLNLGVYTAMENAATVVATWADLARPGRRRSLARSWSGAIFVANVNILRRSDSRICQSYAVGDYICDIHLAHRRLVNVASDGSTRRLELRCPVCDCMSVLSRNADEHAVCLTCAATWSHSQLQRMEQAQRRIAS